MPHTTTEKYRPSRPDTRGNARHRRKVVSAAQDKAKIQGMRVTKIPKKEQKEREHNEVPLPSLTAEEKQLRGLKKKLRSINELIERKEKGLELSKDQQSKMAQLDEVLEAIEELVSKTK